MSATKSSHKSDNFKRRHFLDTVQVSFVAIVWILLFALILATQGCAKQEVAPVMFNQVEDLIIQKPTKFATSNYLVVNRLILSKEGRLQTEGVDLRIEANEIISDEGVIETFEPESTAELGTTGRNGGSITIDAKSGRGVLYVYGRGQNGGHGVEGLVGRNGLPGKDGRNAVGTHASSSFVCECGRVASSLKKDMESSNPVSQIIALQHFFTLKMAHRCISEPSDGQPGECGQLGGPGGDGGNGGNSARIYVTLNDPSALQIKAYSFPGQGGAGGAGGRGGNGGLGGAPGNHHLDFFENCRAAARGLSGAPGNTGTPGKSGTLGQSLPMCIKLASTSFGDCEKFESRNRGAK